MIIGQIIGGGKLGTRFADAGRHPASHPGKFRRRQIVAPSTRRRTCGHPDHRARQRGRVRKPARGRGRTASRHKRELPANPRHAALFARRLLEYKVSAVIDLYELKLVERRRFVKLFLESLIPLPRDLWRPTLVILDEAHIYFPERGSGKAESTEAVISLMSQGRTRGYAEIIATQLLSKLHKDAAAEANNVIIGRTWLDADQARLACPKPTGSSCVTWARVSFTPSARRWVSRESCTFARTRSALFIRAPASVIFSRHQRHRGRFEECWPSLPTCRMRWKRKSEASMRRVGGSPSWSAKSNT